MDELHLREIVCEAHFLEVYQKYFTDPLISTQNTLYQINFETHMAWYLLYCPWPVMASETVWDLAQKGSQTIFLTFFIAWQIPEKCCSDIGIDVLMEGWDWDTGEVAVLRSLLSGAQNTDLASNQPALSAIAAHWYKYRGVGIQGQIILYDRSQTIFLLTNKTRPATSQISVR